jgi:hypothetical protein
MSYALRNKCGAVLDAAAEHFFVRLVQTSSRLDVAEFHQCVSWNVLRESAGRDQPYCNNCGVHRVHLRPSVADFCPLFVLCFPLYPQKETSGGRLACPQMPDAEVGDRAYDCCSLLGGDSPTEAFCSFGRGGNDQPNDLVDRLA